MTAITTATVIPDMCCGLVECLGRTPAEASGNCTRATGIYGLTAELTWYADLLARANRHDRAGRTWKAGNVRSSVAESLARFDGYAPHIIAELPPCTGAGGSGGECGGMTAWEAMTARRARLTS